MSHRLHYLVPLLQLPKAVYRTLIWAIAPQITFVELVKELRKFYSFEPFYSDGFKLTPYNHCPLLDQSYVTSDTFTCYIKNSINTVFSTVFTWNTRSSFFAEHYQIVDRHDFFSKLFEAGIHN
jgi:hypothetical protein